MINVKDTKKEFVKLLEDTDIKSVLDLGCGKAIMSEFFAKRGAKVKGIDIKNVERKIANFEFIQGDFRKFDLKEEYDLIIASLVINFLEKESALKFIQRIKNATSKEGYNLLICMSNKDSLAKKRLENFYPTIQELENIYSDWKVIKRLIDITEVEEHNGQGPHQHHLIFLLTQNK